MQVCREPGRRAWAGDRETLLCRSSGGVLQDASEATRLLWESQKRWLGSERMLGED